MRVDIQLSPAVEPWPVLRDGVLAAEAAGFHTAWVFDHVDGSMLGGTTMLECFTLLGALAASTSRIGLGSMVVNVNNRPVGLMAAAAASVQAMSGGRFVLGLGAGAAPGTSWSAEHARMGIELGATRAERRQRFERALDELDRFWAPDRDPELAAWPAPSPRPPVVVGVNSLELATVAGARCDGINVRSDHERAVELLAAAGEARDAAGRGAAPWDCSVWAHFDEALYDPDHPDRRRWESIGVTRLVLVCLSPHDPAALARFTPSR